MSVCAFVRSVAKKMSSFYIHFYVFITQINVQVDELVNPIEEVKGLPFIAWHTSVAKNTISKKRYEEKNQGEQTRENKRTCELA